MTLYETMLQVVQQLRAAAVLSATTQGALVGAGDGDTRVVDGAAAMRSLVDFRQAVRHQARTLECAVEQLRAVDPSGAWRSPEAPPVAEPGCLSVEVLAVVDDPRFQTPGEKPFVEKVAYWPRVDRWTVTFRAEGAPDAGDFSVKVRCWQHLPDLPASWSPLWQ